MFSALYQTGQSGVEVLSPSGKNPPSRLLKINGPAGLVTKDYERDVKGFKYTLAGKNSQSSSIQCPASTRDSLALTQSILVLQLRSLQQGDPLNLEIVVLDSNAQRRRFLISTTFKVIDINAHHAQIPWFQDYRETWTNVIFNLQYLVQQCFSAKFASIDSFHLRPVCSLRKVFTLPSTLMLGDNENNEGEYLLVPASFDFPFGTTSKTFIFSMTPPPVVLSQQMNAQVPSSDSNGLVVAGQQIGRRRASSVEKKRAEASPLRRGKASVVQNVPKITTTTTSTKITADIPSIESSRLKRSDVLISAGSRTISLDNNATITESSRPPIIISNNSESKKSILNDVNQRHILPRQEHVLIADKPRQEHVSISDKDQADALEKLLLSNNSNRSYSEEELHLPQPPPPRTSISSCPTKQPLQCNPIGIAEDVAYEEKNLVKRQIKEFKSPTIVPTCDSNSALNDFRRSGNLDIVKSTSNADELNQPSILQSLDVILSSSSVPPTTLKILPAPLQPQPLGGAARGPPPPSFSPSQTSLPHSSAHPSLLDQDVMNNYADQLSEPDDYRVENEDNNVKDKDNNNIKNETVSTPRSPFPRREEEFNSSTAVNSRGSSSREAFDATDHRMEDSDQLRLTAPIINITDEKQDWPPSHSVHQPTLEDLMDETECEAMTL